MCANFRKIARKLSSYCPYFIYIVQNVVEIMLILSLLKIFDTNIEIFDRNIEIFDTTIEIFNKTIEIFDANIEIFENSCRIFENLFFYVKIKPKIKKIITSRVLENFPLSYSMFFSQFFSCNTVPLNSLLFTIF